MFLSFPRAWVAFLAASTLSQLGNSVLWFALGWAAAAHGGQVAALVLTASGLPRLLLVLVGGSVADRVGARRLLLCSEAVMFVVCLALAGGLHATGPQPWLLAAASLASGVVSAFSLPAMGSMPRRLVDDAVLPRALALRQGLSQAVLLAGAPLGGVLVATVGLPAIAIADAVCFAAVLVVLAVIRPRHHADPSTGPLWRSLSDGARVVVGTPGLARALLLTGAMAAAVLPVSSLLVPLLGRESGWGAGATGVVVGAQAAGSIVAALVVARTGTTSRTGRAVGLGLTAAAAGVALVASGSGDAVTLVVGAAVVVGAGTGIAVAHLAPFVLGSAPRTHLARVQAWTSLAQLAPVVVSNNLLGATAAWLSPSAALLCCAAMLGMCALAAVRLRTAVPAAASA
ncbi:MFS transporter [Myceligenerans pegani]|uniref:MFS transporter n=1 Tax=Myceligenerans pegani TaxID=2776917 RepID=A0ABR9MYY4_9MICO|nr:MFS transporter [Myceligenerans sp. TRM 65318]MBE1876603.1 MFS transporter [Myceligenerans sp. TRM 65318]MBE3018874.1 MFS transporter [Myceligenerans sp. TRM 65318]